jgi:hypothetical protein
MTISSNTSFVPVLTVMVDYGNAPFLWLVDSPDDGGVGGNLCDGTYWDQSFPMSEGLWQKFADWAIEFDRTAFYSDNFDADGWDWIAFHARGLQLSRWLKEEVGDAYHVVYDKPCEDPNHRIDERTEILADGGLVTLPPFRSSFPEQILFCQRIVSGGQTGADRAALDFAYRTGIPHGGWCPKGRLAVDGPLSFKYQLRETESKGYRQRTKLNVQDSDATLIFNIGELDGGSQQTVRFAEALKKPHRIFQLDQMKPEGIAIEIAEWLKQGHYAVLNIAGPREERRPGIYALVLSVLDLCLRGTNATDNTP